MWTVHISLWIKLLVILLVNALCVCVAFVWSFELTFILWCILLIFLTFHFSLLLPLLFTNCDWFPFSLNLLGGVLPDLAIFRLSSFSFCVTVVSDMVCSCWGGILFHFPEVSSTSYLLRAYVINFYGVISWPSLYLFLLLFMYLTNSESGAT